jgi:hypothetical protein
MIRNIFGPAGKVAHFLVFVLIAVVENEVVAWLPIPGIVDLPLTEDLGGFFIFSLLIRNAPAGKSATAVIFPSPPAHA